MLQLHALHAPRELDCKGYSCKHIGWSCSVLYCSTCIHIHLSWHGMLWKIGRCWHRISWSSFQYERGSISSHLHIWQTSSHSNLEWINRLITLKGINWLIHTYLSLIATISFNAWYFQSKVVPVLTMILQFATGIACHWNVWADWNMTHTVVKSTLQSTISILLDW